MDQVAQAPVIGQSRLRPPTKIKRPQLKQPNQDIEPQAKKAKTCKDDKENLPGLRQNTTKISKAATGRNSKPNSHLNSASTMRHKVGSNMSNNRSGIKSQMKSKPTLNKTVKKVAPSTARSALQPVGNKINTKMATKSSEKKATTKTIQSKTTSTSTKPVTIEDLNATLASIQAEVKKLPKYDLKRKGELHQKGFLLIPSLRQAYLDEYGGYEEKLQQMTIESKNLKESLTDVNEKYKVNVAQVASLTTNLDNVQQELKLKQAECQRLTETIEKLNNEVHNHLKTIDERDAEIRENETVRRKLHNEVQELKGNIRVYCRVRPLLDGEDNQGHDLQVIFDSQCDKNIRIQHDNTNESGRGKTTSEKFDFTFDKVFDPSSTQENIFYEISQLVQSALDGYNVCIFAYGQTGSGKTYTMEGCPNNNSKAGMIPRAVNQIFASAKELSTKGWKYDLEASFLEIYNETVRDLLASNSKKENTKYEIKLVKSGSGANRVTVSNAKIVKVESETQVCELLKTASRHRATAATKCNEQSSRSHSVFRLNLVGSNKITGQNCEGTLNLVDLAGSERIAVSGVTGDRLNEAKNINKSLSTLSKVILSLANKDSHIPYRNSKLTYLLQNSLGGNSKTLMFVNISPSVDCFHESLNSLRFATKVNNCHIGTATKKVK